MTFNFTWLGRGGLKMRKKLHPTTSLVTQSLKRKKRKFLQSFCNSQSKSMPTFVKRLLAIITFAFVLFVDHQQLNQMLFHISSNRNNKAFLMISMATGMYEK